MNFDRYRVQSSVETDIGCTDLTKWSSYLQKFKDYEITRSRRDKLNVELRADSCDIYYKAIYSLAEAVNSLYHRRHSWAVIKIYYAVFFLLRCSLATEKIAFLKNKGIYTLLLSDGEKPVKRDTGTHLGERVSGDHKTTIVTYKSLFSDTDILQSNSIDGKNIYDWLMQLRNQVNYRERCFTEPNNKYFHPSIFDKSTIKERVDEYLADDTFVYCFDEDHCALAAPLKLASIVRAQLDSFVEFDPIDEVRKVEINRLLSDSRLFQSDAFRSLYQFQRS